MVPLSAPRKTSHILLLPPSRFLLVACPPRPMAKISPAVAVGLVAAMACLLSSPSIAVRDVMEQTEQFIVHGRVFCDTCQAGFETPASTYVAGAKVKVECFTKDTRAKTCSFDGVTDSTGTYNILVPNDHENEDCESALVSSSDTDCASPVKGRETAPVFLTSNNGIASQKRLANSLGFEKSQPLALCAKLMEQYQPY